MVPLNCDGYRKDGYKTTQRLYVDGKDNEDGRIWLYCMKCLRVKPQNGTRHFWQLQAEQKQSFS